MDSQMKLVFASNNAHKLCEVRAMMPAGIEVLSLHEIGFEHEIDETGTTLAENSKIKAETIVEWLKTNHKWATVDGVFADDTGLEIDALGGQPGVYSARWAGSAEANRKKALRELEGKDNRNCHFKTVITLITNNLTTQVEGIVRGRIATEEYGEGGFGYDPVFIPEGYDKTFGELPAEVKNSISHRGLAMANLVKLLKMYDY